VWRIRAAKAQALATLGDGDSAARELEETAVLLRQLADAIPDHELRRVFLANPQVLSIVTSANGDS
jgi:hypothetical protein